jgi:hypothetical protein
MADRCETCSAWSQLVAEAIPGTSIIQALCLNPASPHSAKYTRERQGCAHWSDDPALSDLEAMRHG